MSAISPAAKISLNISGAFKNSFRSSYSTSNILPRLVLENLSSSLTSRISNRLPQKSIIVNRMTSNGAVANGSNGVSKEKKPFSRLPSNVQPIHYEIFLKPDLKDLSFVGSMNVTLSVTQATDTIVCNAADLSVTDVQVNGNATNDVVLSKDTETMTVRLNTPLPEHSQVTLSCNFKGELNDMMRGMNQ